MVDDESHLTKPASGRVLQASGDVNSLASATHCFMSPLCYSRSFRRATMEAVRRSRALRCLTTYRAIPHLERPARAHSPAGRMATHTEESVRLRLRLRLHLAAWLFSQIMIFTARDGRIDASLTAHGVSAPREGGRSGIGPYPL